MAGRPILRGSGSQIGRWLWERYGRALPKVILESAADDFGIRVETQPFRAETSGFLWCADDDRYVITLNANHPEPRRLFTFGHELGHFFRDYGAGRAAFNRVAATCMERESDACAAEILLPVEDARELQAAIGDDLGSPAVTSIARARSASPSAIRTRLRVLAETGWMVRPREIVVEQARGVFHDKSLGEEFGEFTGWITGHHASRRRWAGRHFACISPDGESAVGDPGGRCSKCRSDSDACHTYATVYVEQLGEAFAARLSLSQSSQGPWQAYVAQHLWLGGHQTVFHLQRLPHAYPPRWDVVPTARSAPGAGSIQPRHHRERAEEQLFPSSTPLLLRASEASPAVLATISAYCDLHGGRRAAAYVRREAASTG